MTFGERLKILRTNHNWTSKELGKKFGVAESTISGYELGNRNPDFETLIQMSELFDVTLDYLLKGDITEYTNSFGSRIKKLRADRGWTQASFADRLEVTSQVISNYERDYREPEFATLIRIARLFKVTTDYLLGIEVEK